MKTLTLTLNIPEYSTYPMRNGFGQGHPMERLLVIAAIAHSQVAISNGTDDAPMDEVSEEFQRISGQSKQYSDKFLEFMVADSVFAAS